MKRALGARGTTLRMSVWAAYPPTHWGELASWATGQRSGKLMHYPRAGAPRFVIAAPAKVNDAMPTSISAR
jgi:hypothetical protein